MSWLLAIYDTFTHDRMMWRLVKAAGLSGNWSQLAEHLERRPACSRCMRTGAWIAWNKKP